MTTSVHQVETIVGSAWSTDVLIDVAAFRASNATAANGWDATQYAWEIASSGGPSAAADYWLMVAAEDGEEIARHEIADALVAVGWTLANVNNAKS